MAASSLPYINLFELIGFPAIHKNIFPWTGVACSLHKNCIKLSIGWPGSSYIYELEIFQALLFWPSISWNNLPGKRSRIILEPLTSEPFGHEPNGGQYSIRPENFHYPPHHRGMELFTSHRHHAFSVDTTRIESIYHKLVLQRTVKYPITSPSVISWTALRHILLVVAQWWTVLYVPHKRCTHEIAVISHQKIYVETRTPYFVQCAHDASGHGTNPHTPNIMITTWRKCGSGRPAQHYVSVVFAVRPSFRVSSGDAFRCRYPLTAFWIFSLSLISMSSLRIWSTNTFNIEETYFLRQESSNLHPKIFKCLGARKQAFVVDPVLIRKLRTVPHGGQNLLKRCVINETGFCSGCTRRCLLGLAGQSIPSTDFVNDCFWTPSVTLVLGENHWSFGTWMS